MNEVQKCLDELKKIQQEKLIEDQEKYTEITRLREAIEELSDTYSTIIQKFKQCIRERELLQKQIEFAESNK